MALVKSHKKILDNFYASNKQTVIDYDDLPSTVRNALEGVKFTETLWCDSVRYLNDLQTKDLIAQRGRW
jgi:hypothetical protein